MSLLDDLLRAVGVNPTQARWRWRRWRTRKDGPTPPPRPRPVHDDDGTPFATILLIGACAVLYFVTVKASHDAAPSGGSSGSTPINLILLRYGATHPLLTWGEGEWWRAVTAVFLHGSVMHLLMNSISMWVIGRVIEERFGAARLIVVFVLAGIAGFVASTWWKLGGQAGPSVGASGAVFGLLGCAVGHALARRGRSAQELRARLVPWLLFSLMMGFASRNIDNAAHLGGLALGLVLGPLLGERDLARRRGGVFWGVLAVLALGLVVASFVLVARHDFVARLEAGGQR